MTGRRDIERLQEQLDELFQDLWHVPRFSGVRRGFRPHVDVYRIDEPPELTIVVELPGVDPERVAIALDGRELIVAGERPRPKLGCRPSYYQLELEYGLFQRRVTLPEEVDGARARASYEHGLLTIVLPLAQRPEQAARVSIPVTAHR